MVRRIPHDRTCYTCGSSRTYINIKGNPIWRKAEVQGSYNCLYCWRRTEKAREYSREYAKGWRNRYPNRYREYQEKYLPSWWNRNQDKHHEYYINNYRGKDGKEKKKEYYIANREEILRKKKEHRIINKAMYKERDRLKYLKSIGVNND